MKKNVMVGLIGIGAICLAAPTMAADANSGEEVTIVTVDYKGKPPFKRRTETLPMADVAALDAAKTTRISTVDFKGKPPFRRNVETVNVVDMAVLEPANEQSRTSFRGKPPFKRKP